jgi:hypothetical protein
MKWYPLIEKTLYGIKIDDLLFNGTSTGMCAELKKVNKMGCVLALDSGSTYMSVPSKIMDVLK